ncbi:hypothetical protein K445DRAFT_196390 [Daldinia sp. EC12]|nr:hypothetical protein K445DRAFT_196390 [Daldinia sp. EC12]
MRDLLVPPSRHSIASSLMLRRTFYFLSRKDSCYPENKLGAPFETAKNSTSDVASTNQRQKDTTSQHMQYMASSLYSIRFLPDRIA